MSRVLLHAWYNISALINNISLVLPFLCVFVVFLLLLCVCVAVVLVAAAVAAAAVVSALQVFISLS